MSRLLSLRSMGESWSTELSLWRFELSTSTSYLLLTRLTPRVMISCFLLLFNPLGVLSVVLGNVSFGTETGLLFLEVSFALVG